jgi:hypothetical protein
VLQFLTRPPVRRADAGLAVVGFVLVWAALSVLTFDGLRQVVAPVVTPGNSSR